jgi:hypothetical protein
MKPQEINKLQALDPTGMNGTIQSILLDPNINQASYPDVLYYLLAKTLDERKYYEKMYQKFFNVLTANNLMSNELLELEEK